MAEYHVGCGIAGIYAGTLNPRYRGIWQNKSCVTDEAICAVRDYMKLNLLGNGVVSSGYEWDTKDGKVIELRITIKERGENPKESPSKN